MRARTSPGDETEDDVRIPAVGITRPRLGLLHVLDEVGVACVDDRRPRQVDRGRDDRVRPQGLVELVQERLDAVLAGPVDVTLLRQRQQRPGLELLRLEEVHRHPPEVPLPLGADVEAGRLLVGQEGGREDASADLLHGGLQRRELEVRDLLHPVDVGVLPDQAVQVALLLVGPLGGEADHLLLVALRDLVHELGVGDPAGKRPSTSASNRRRVLGVTVRTPEAGSRPFCPSSSPGRGARGSGGDSPSSRSTRRR